MDLVCSEPNKIQILDNTPHSQSFRNNKAKFNQDL